MGLDASVACDCYERGLARRPPPPGVAVSVGPDGFLTILNDTPTEQWHAFMDWADGMCEHETQKLLHHRLGNIAGIGAVRGLLEHSPGRYPILLQRVVY